MAVVFRKLLNKSWLVVRAWVRLLGVMLRIFERHGTGGRSDYSYEFIASLNDFITYACSQPGAVLNGGIHGPCTYHRNRAILSPDTVMVDLVTNGFMPDYWVWIAHGERPENVIAPQNIARSDYDADEDATIAVSCDDDDAVGDDDDVGDDDATHHISPPIDSHTARGGSSSNNAHASMDNAELPHPAATVFFDHLHSNQQPIYPGCETMSQLALNVQLLSLQSEGNISHRSMNDVCRILQDSTPEGSSIPQRFYDVQRNLKQLGSDYKLIDCCTNGCMLYYGNDMTSTECKFCDHPRYDRRKKGKQIPFKRMHYLPLTPRLQRLFASARTAEHMRSHNDKRRPDNMLCHPSDREQWKHFDRSHPQFSADPRNVRLGLCADGFNPFKDNSTAYSCWPIIVTPYNLPPDLCMTDPFMFLTAIIPGPHNPKARIDLYLQPLIDELQLLWSTGVITYDVSTQQNFFMRAALLWTINDYPAYGMLSGWSTCDRLACAVFMENTKSFRLHHGRKNTWFDCHRQFLPAEHAFRRNKNSFYKNRIERTLPPIRLNGEQLWERVSPIPKIYQLPVNYGQFPSYGRTHNWTKQSIFWELPYWKTLLVRHNLDVMHIEKNVFDNVFHTVMDNKEKTKDNTKARLDLPLYCKRQELELVQVQNGKFAKPKAKYTFSAEQKKAICEWVSKLKMPDGYASNISRCVDHQQSKLKGMKSHDCHIFMQRLLPIAFMPLPRDIWKPLSELSMFFRDLCSVELRAQNIRTLHRNIPHILCRLERIFPPAFFDSMEHLCVHLPFEALVGGPVQYRWMYPFERY